MTTIERLHRRTPISLCESMNVRCTLKAALSVAWERRVATGHRIVKDECPFIGQTGLSIIASLVRGDRPLFQECDRATSTCRPLQLGHVMLGTGLPSRPKLACHVCS
jgi:hypothetical protein